MTTMLTNPKRLRRGRQFTADGNGHQVSNSSTPNAQAPDHKAYALDRITVDAQQGVRTIIDLGLGRPRRSRC
jgi:hypothetical protein